MKKWEIGGTRVSCHLLTDSLCWSLRGREDTERFHSRPGRRGHSNSAQLTTLQGSLKECRATPQLVQVAWGGMRGDTPT